MKRVGWESKVTKINILTSNMELPEQIIKTRKIIVANRCCSCQGSHGVGGTARHTQHGEECRDLEGHAVKTSLGTVVAVPHAVELAANNVSHQSTSSGTGVAKTRHDSEEQHLGKTLNVVLVGTLGTGVVKPLLVCELLCVGSVRHVGERSLRDVVAILLLEALVLVTQVVLNPLHAHGLVASNEPTLQGAVEAHSNQTCHDVAVFLRNGEGHRHCNMRVEGVGSGVWCVCG